MSQGEVKNFGKPINLLMDETTILYELTEKLSKSEKQTLFNIISQNEFNRLKKIELNYKSTIDTENVLVEKKVEESGTHTNLGLVEDET